MLLETHPWSRTDWVLSKWKLTIQRIIWLLKSRVAIFAIKNLNSVKSLDETCLRQGLLDHYSPKPLSLAHCQISFPANIKISILHKLYVLLSSNCELMIFFLTHNVLYKIRLVVEIPGNCLIVIILYFLISRQYNEVNKCSYYMAFANWRIHNRSQNIWIFELAHSILVRFTCSFKYFP